MSKAQTKPLIVDYLPYEGYIEEVIHWVDGFLDIFGEHFGTLRDDLYIDGIGKVLEGDIIIRDERGYYSTLNKDSFYKTYNIL